VQNEKGKGARERKNLTPRLERTRGCGRKDKKGPRILFKSRTRFPPVTPKRQRRKLKGSC